MPEPARQPDSAAAAFGILDHPHRFSRILYSFPTDKQPRCQQYLLRLCHNVGLVGMPVPVPEKEPFRAMTIDSEQPVAGGEPNCRRLVLNFQPRPKGQPLPFGTACLPIALFGPELLDIVDPRDCMALDWIMERVESGEYDQRAAMAAVTELAENLVLRLRNAYPEAFK